MARPLRLEFEGALCPVMSRGNAREDIFLDAGDRTAFLANLGRAAERFDRRWDEIHALDPRRFGERVRRTWRTYLWSCAELFRAQRPQIGLFQVLVSKGNVGAVYPLTRAFLYRP